MECNTDKTTTCLSKSWKIIHIPGKPPALPHVQETVEVLVSVIEPKHANSIVRKLNIVAPLEGLRHVKRIRKTCLDGGKYQLFIILCLAPGNDGEPKCMPMGVEELVNSYQLSTFVTKVCKHAASTKEEWDEQCKLWPTSFHPPTYNIDGIAGFSEEDSLSVFNFMKLAVGIAMSSNPVVNTAVIVDPTTRQVIASATDQVLPLYDSLNKSEHPEASRKIDAVEIVKEPVLLPKCSSFYNAEQSYKGISCLNPWGWIGQQSHAHPNSWHPLHHAAIVAIENSAARDRLLFPLTNQSAECAQEEYNASSPIGSPLKRQKITTNATDEYKTNHHCSGFQCDSTRPYLCTGYDIYFVWEPCAMCAMAIVHQRVKRLFYAFPNPKNGALGSVHRLQGERSLNHHYAVFRVLMPEDVLETAARQSLQR